MIIVADRGGLRAYAVEKNDTGNHQIPRLLDAMEIDEARGPFRENFSDRAGSFPDATSPGQANPTAERMNLAAEYEMRSFRAVAARVIELLREHAPERWAFAAPSEINGAILDGLPVDLRERLAKNVRRDLVNVPASDLLRHFD
ncbi:MAG: host attachment protein [Terrimicrobiaceae bacterium]|nr:host attachment protein [Terrimicrobiaceae bacterium]